MKKNKIEISIIIPVYNVYEWIDQCLESIVGQTFEDFEVILIDDGSTDGSQLKCKEWANRDSRIRVIRQQNAGPAIARNKGIMEAQGKYLSFIDADDWIDKNFLSELHTAAIDTNADIIECDVWRYNDRTGKKTRRICYGCAGKEYTKNEHMIYGYTAVWKCMFRRQLFVENNIYFPDCHSEARAIYALLIALSNDIVNVRKPLYYYRKFRKNSLSQNPRGITESSNAIGIQAYDKLIEAFKKRQMFEEYSLTLEKSIKYKCSDILCGLFTLKEEGDLDQLAHNYQQFMLRLFPNRTDEKYAVLGGYNLNRITWYMNMLHIPSLRFNFSGIISITHPISPVDKVVHQNRYREIMINRDIQSDFWNVLSKEQPSYLVLDFIEDRNDVIKFKDGYLTKSEAYTGCEYSMEGGEQIDADSEQYKCLWEQSCIMFIKRLRECYPQLQVVLVKNYLSEYVGDIYHQDSYSEIDWIRKVNARLKHYYDFFEANCDFAKSVEASRCEYYFTDREYEYGAEPAHLNDLVNRKIAAKIEEQLGSMTQKFIDR